MVDVEVPYRYVEVRPAFFCRFYVGAVLWPFRLAALDFSVDEILPRFDQRIACFYGVGSLDPVAG
jgi:hypothetical protein